MSWDELSSILLERFPDLLAPDPMDQLQQLKQISTVNAYIDTYETWMTQMKRERTYLPNEFFVDRFISGLKEGIKHNVQCQKTDSLLSAYWYARQYEKAYLSNTKRNITPLAAPRNPIPPARPLPAPTVIPGQAPAREFRNRAPQKCWYCPDNWSIGHRCQPMQ
jgi:hypothetical protein